MQRCLAQMNNASDAQRADKNRNRGKANHSSLPEFASERSSPRQAVTRHAPSFQLRHDPTCGDDEPKHQDFTGQQDSRREWIWSNLGLAHQATERRDAKKYATKYSK